MTVTFPSVEQTDRPPNVLLILADDMGNHDLGAFAGSPRQTPRLDALAAGGVQFSRHYAYATCRPARAALLTGQSMANVGVVPHFRGISPELETLPEALQNAGYRTYHIGKWHIGDLLASAGPLNQGFDHFYGFRSALATEFGTVSRPGISYQNPFLIRDREPPAQQAGHMTDLLAAETIDTIQHLAGTSTPWFINLWWLAPHEPVQPAARVAESFPDTAAGRYIALMSQLDDAVGAIMDSLAETGQLENTVVVFLSDNGGTNNSVDNNRPYSGKKGDFFEGGLRTPLIVHYPKIRPNRIREPVYIRDVMPTVLGFAGIDVPERVEGRNLGPLFNGGSVDRVARYFYELQVPDLLFWGVLDLELGRLFNGGQVQDWVNEKQYFDSPREADPEELEAARAMHAAWRRETRRVPLQATSLPGGGAAYTGDSYRRSPGYGPWSLQVPIRTDGPEAAVLEQSDLLQVRASAGKLDVTLPGYQKSLEIGAHGCHLLTLSTHYRWRVRSPKDADARVSVFLGNELLSEEAFPIDASVLIDSFPPLLAGPEVGLPQIHNDVVSSEPLARYSRSVSCPQVVAADI